MVEKKVNTINEENKKKKKRLFIIFGSILGAGAIAGASVGIYFAVKRNNTGKVVATVTEQEFDKAVSLEGVSFFQVKLKQQEYELKYEFSPTIYYKSVYKKNTFTNDSDGEKMVRKKDDGTYEKVRKNSGEDWGDVTVAEADDFKYPSSEAPTNYLTALSLTYSSFSFSNEKYNWENSEGSSVSLYFMDKKCVKLEFVVGEASATIDYTYENKTPVWPK